MKCPPITRDDLNEDLQVLCKTAGYAYSPDGQGINDALTIRYHSGFYYTCNVETVDGREPFGAKHHTYTEMHDILYFAQALLYRIAERRKETKGFLMADYEYEQAHMREAQDNGPPA